MLYLGQGEEYPFITNHNIPNGTMFMVELCNDYIHREKVGRFCFLIVGEAIWASRRSYRLYITRVVMYVAT